MDVPDLESARQKANDREMRAAADRASATPVTYTDSSRLPPYMRRLHDAQMRAYYGVPAPGPLTQTVRKVRRFIAGE